MVKIVPLDEYRRQRLLRVGFKRWRQRFDQSFHDQTRLADLKAPTLYQLSLSGGEALTDLYALIIGFLGYPDNVVFDDLDPLMQSRVLDIHLFMSDQIRFEMMFRLRWLDKFESHRMLLIEFVTEFECIKGKFSLYPPSLAKTHADYDVYCKLYILDQQIFLRRLFPAALTAFKNENRL